MMLKKRREERREEKRRDEDVCGERSRVNLVSGVDATRVSSKR